MAQAGLIISHLFNEQIPLAHFLADQHQLWSLRRLPEPDWLAGEKKRRFFHWNLGPVLSCFKKSFFEQKLNVLLNEYDIELFSFDLGPAARHHQSILPLSSPLSVDDIYRHSESAIKLIRRYYRGPLAVENYNYYPTGLYGHITEATFIKSYLEEFGLNLTLDLAHGAVTAHNTGFKPMDYFESLPLEKTVEIHLSRPFLPQDKKLWAVDRHSPPKEREWHWLKRLIKNKRISNDAVVFLEYYRDLGKLELAQKQLVDILTKG